MKNIELPHKLSDLMELALADLAKVEAMPEKFHISMTEWMYLNTSTQLCHVCFAGAVMAMSLEIDPEESKYLGRLFTEMGYHNSNCTSALNCARLGEVYDALLYMGVPTRDIPNGINRDVVSYHVDRSKWRQQMNEIVVSLRQHDL